MIQQAGKTLKLLMDARGISELDMAEKLKISIEELQEGILRDSWNEHTLNEVMNLFIDISQNNKDGFIPDKS